MANIDSLNALPPLMDAVPRLQAQTILHCGHNKLYTLLREGKLDAVKDGSRTMVTVESIRRYQANRPRAVFKPPLPAPAPQSRRLRRRRAKGAAE